MLHGPASSKTKLIRDSLAMMERIQQITGTKPLGEHATMADWNDTSTVEREAVAMMRHYGLMSMGVESMAPLPLKEESYSSASQRPSEVSLDNRSRILSASQDTSGKGIPHKQSLDKLQRFWIVVPHCQRHHF
ncbi:Hypothetical predicted protein [Drosophila guanche]|uniref:Uncharacterized protein n=1 Tax=Drosophila guanche TaxID=7266 RepID=A0A3B0K2V5_DROGU|nr:Hypothetical predicted protein [Drosophila guanche]